MFNAHENLKGALPNGIDDLSCVNRLIEIIQKYRRETQDSKSLEEIIGQISEVINLMPFKAGSLRAKVADIPWEHFSVLAEIIFADEHRSAKVLRELLTYKNCRSGIKEEIFAFEKRLHELRKELIEGPKQARSDLDCLLEDITDFDKDDSLEKEPQQYKSIQAITSFYRDHLALQRIQQLLQLSQNINSDGREGKKLAGLIISLGEEVKKLSNHRRVEFSLLEGIPLSHHNLSMLNRLWLYKKCRDAIRHAADYPEHQLIDLLKILTELSSITEIRHHMRDDEDLVIGYCEEELQAEWEEFISKNKPEKRFEYLKAKASKEPKVEKPKIKKEKPIRVITNEQALPDQIDPEFTSFDDHAFDLLVENLKATHKNEEAKINLVIANLKKFLLEGKLSIYFATENNSKNNKAERGKALGNIRSVLGIGKVISELKEKLKIVGLSEEAKESLDDQLQFYVQINTFLEKAFIGGPSPKTSPVLTNESKKKDPQKISIWGQTHVDFLAEIGAFAKTTVTPKLANHAKKLGEDVYMGQSKVQLHDFLFSEFFGKGFRLDSKALTLLREFTGTTDKCFDDVFDQLAKGQSYTGNVDLKEVKRKFALFFFGHENPDVFFARADAQENVITKMKSTRFANWDFILNQFNNAFYNPENMKLRNNGEIRPLEFVTLGVSSLRPWEAEYEAIQDPLLNIRMLLSSKYREKIAKSQGEWKEFEILNPEDIANKFRLHITEIKDLLEETEKLFAKTKLLANSKSLKDVVNGLGIDSNLLIFNMALVSQHIAGIYTIALKFLIPYMENPPSESMRAKEKREDNELVEKFKEYISVLRTCGNSLAHMDLSKAQQLGEIFSAQDFSNILYLLKETLRSLDEIIEFIPIQFETIRTLLAERLKEEYANNPEPTEVKKGSPEQAFIDSFTTRVMQVAYPHSKLSLYNAITSFGIFKSEPSQAQIPDKEETEVIKIESPTTCK